MSGTGRGLANEQTFECEVIEGDWRRPRRKVEVEVAAAGPQHVHHDTVGDEVCGVRDAYNTINACKSSIP